MKMDLQPAKNIRYKMKEREMKKKRIDIFEHKYAFLRCKIYIL